MGKTRKEFEYLLENLSRAQSEDEVISYLKNMIKGFSSSFYQECILSNPYYKSLFLEIREDVLEDLDSMKKALEEEMDSIDENIKISSDKDVISKLKDIKSDCVLLLREIDIKKEELISVI